MKRTIDDASASSMVFFSVAMGYEKDSFGIFAYEFELLHSNSI